MKKVALSLSVAILAVVIFSASISFSQENLRTETVLWGNNRITDPRFSQSLSIFPSFPVWSQDTDQLMLLDLKDIKVSGIAAFPKMMCGLKNDASVWCLNLEKKAFEKVQNLPPVKKIDSQGGMKICSHTTEDKVVCWGWSDATSYPDALPDARMHHLLDPSENFQKLMNSFIDIKVNDRTSCAITHLGSVWCWGMEYSFGSHRELPLSNPELANSYPGFILSRVKIPVGVEDIRISRNYTCALLKDKSVWCWKNEPNPVGEKISPETIKAKALTISYKDACILSEDGSVYCWELGNRLVRQLKFSNGQTLNNVVKIYNNGSEFSCGLRADKTLVCWGGPSMFINNVNACYNDDCKTPYVIKSPNGFCNLTNIKNIAIGNDFAFISVEGNNKYFEQFDLPDRSTEIFATIIAGDYIRAHDLMAKSTCLNMNLPIAQDALLSVILHENVEFLQLFIDRGVDLRSIQRIGDRLIGMPNGPRSIKNPDVIALLKAAGVVASKSDRP